MRLRPFRRAAGGFLLLEIILAVLIFAMGALALGRCMSNVLEAQQDRVQEDRVRLALANRMLEIQASVALPDEKKEHRLTEAFAGITLLETRHTLDVKDENNVALPNLHEMTLKAQWNEGGLPQSRSISFYLLRGS